MKELELLAPARNLETGLAAIQCGADAVYIGGPRFGARAAAGNSIDDIAQLCNYAHIYGAKVYATVNTMFHADETEAAVRQINDLYHVGVDAVLIQDIRLLSRRLPLISLHASTQMDNRTLEHCLNLYQCGIRRVVLARELSLQQIHELHRKLPHDMQLEAFVHGALCISYSGRCHASQHCFSRSADRGECAQICRMRFSLLDSQGRRIGPDAHYLSLKDLCRLQHLEAMAEAGVVSFKIEGRLKDEAYVRNVVSAYNEELQRIVLKYPDKYVRLSRYTTLANIHSDVRKTFNRGFTDYFLTQAHSSPRMWSPYTPKAIGEYVGDVENITPQYITVKTDVNTTFSNGDGLCFFHTSDQDVPTLIGFRVNNVEGKCLFPLHMPTQITRGTSLYRNHDEAFIRSICRQQVQRRIDIGLRISPTPEGYRLTATENSSQDNSVSILFPFQHQIAKKTQEENIIRQLSKWGATLYHCTKVDLAEDMSNHFIPTRTLNEMRRQLAIALSDNNKASTSINSFRPVSADALHKLEERQYANTSSSNPLMICRFCLKQALGLCSKHPLGEPSPIQLFSRRIPKYLKMDNGMKFHLEFDCHQCQTNIYALT